jgi:hypothetical protein
MGFFGGLFKGVTAGLEQAHNQRIRQGEQLRLLGDDLARQKDKYHAELQEVENALANPKVLTPERLDYLRGRQTILQARLPDIDKQLENVTKEVYKAYGMKYVPEAHEVIKNLHSNIVQGGGEDVYATNTPSLSDAVSGQQNQPLLGLADLPSGTMAAPNLATMAPTEAGMGVRGATFPYSFGTGTAVTPPQAGGASPVGTTLATTPGVEMATSGVASATQPPQPQAAAPQQQAATPRTLRKPTYTPGEMAYSNEEYIAPAKENLRQILADEKAKDPSLNYGTALTNSAIIEAKDQYNTDLNALVNAGRKIEGIPTAEDIIEESFPISVMGGALKLPLTRALKMPGFVNPTITHVPTGVMGSDIQDKAAERGQTHTTMSGLSIANLDRNRAYFPSYDNYGNLTDVSAMTGTPKSSYAYDENNNIVQVYSDPVSGRVFSVNRNVVPPFSVGGRTTTTVTQKLVTQPDGTQLVVPITTTTVRSPSGRGPGSAPSGTATGVGGAKETGTKTSETASPFAPARRQIAQADRQAQQELGKPWTGQGPLRPGMTVPGKAPREYLTIWEPVMKAEIRYRTMLENTQKPTAQGDISILFNHIGMTGGAQTGYRMTESQIEAAAKARSLPAGIAAWLQSTGIVPDDVYRWFNQDPKDWPSGGFLTPVQRENMLDLAKKMRRLQWASARAKSQVMGLTREPQPIAGPLEEEKGQGQTKKEESIEAKTKRIRDMLNAMPGKPQ